MSVELPGPIYEYFTASNAGVIERMIAPFADHAIVKDEGIERVGRTAIRNWMEDTTHKYGATATPEHLDQASGATAVTALVSGNFPGSPVHLTYRFSIERDQIIRLEIA
jgi:hypothetical protein